jgi:hypothetical protein
VQQTPAHTVILKGDHVPQNWDVIEYREKHNRDKRKNVKLPCPQKGGFSVQLFSRQHKLSLDLEFGNYQACSGTNRVLEQVYYIPAAGPVNPAIFAIY